MNNLFNKHLKLVNQQIFNRINIEIPESSTAVFAKKAKYERLFTIRQSNFSFYQLDQIKKQKKKNLRYLQAGVKLRINSLNMNRNHVKKRIQKPSTETSQSIKTMKVYQPSSRERNYIMIKNKAQTYQVRGLGKPRKSNLPFIDTNPSKIQNVGPWEDTQQ